jgi:hypothetical protein
VTLAARTRTPNATTLLLWVALGAASLAVLGDLLEHWIASPWSRYSLLFTALYAWACRGTHATDPDRELGRALVAFGAVFEVLAIGGGFDRYGRIGLGIALVGMTCLHGVPSWSRRLAVLWIIPVPHFIVSGFGEPILAHWATLGAAVANAWAPGSLWSDVSVWLAEEPSFLLDGVAGGLSVALVLAGCGWMTVARVGGPLSDACWRGVLWSLLAVPLQAACVVSAAVLLTAEQVAPSTVANGLMHATWVLGAIVGLLLCRKQRAEG